MMVVMMVVVVTVIKFIFFHCFIVSFFHFFIFLRLRNRYQSGERSLPGGRDRGLPDIIRDAATIRFRAHV